MDNFVLLLKKIGECCRTRLEPRAAQGTASAHRKIGEDLDWWRRSLRHRCEHPSYQDTLSPAFEFASGLFLYLRFETLVDSLRTRDNTPPTQTERKAVTKCLKKVADLCGPYY